MAVGINPKKRIPFVLKGDRRLKKEKQSRFMLKAIAADIWADMMDDFTGSRGTIRINLGKEHIRLLKAGLDGWENFKVPGDENGQLIDAPFEKDDEGVPTIETLTALTLDQRIEISTAILHENQISGDDRKKSK